jgi:AcrR family transcriptional regulator
MASMSPQPADPDVRRRLIEAAARVLGEEGPSGLSTRKLAAEVGTSTMAVYTHFGGLPALVAAVADEGFTRLAEHMAQTSRTEDALADLAQLAMAYRSNALDNPHLYSVMFGSVSLGGYRQVNSDDHGRYTFEVLVTATQRAMDEGQLAPGDAESVAAQMWSALHGFVTLELAGFLKEEDGALEKVLWPLMANLVLSLRGTAPPEDGSQRDASKRAITGRQPANPTSAERPRRSRVRAAGATRTPDTAR